MSYSCLLCCLQVVSPFLKQQTTEILTTCKYRYYILGPGAMTWWYCIVFFFITMYHVSPCSPGLHRYLGGLHLTAGCCRWLFVVDLTLTRVAQMKGFQYMWRRFLSGDDTNFQEPHLFCEPHITSRTGWGAGPVHTHPWSLPDDIELSPHTRMV